MGGLVRDDVVAERGGDQAVAQRESGGVVTGREVAE